MMLVAQKLNNPPPGWVAPQPAVAKKTAAPVASVDFAGALSMPQFYILWLVLFLNISAGIALISKLSPIAQEQVKLGAVAAGTLVGVCSLFNGLGRIFWAAVSDKIGRKPVFLLILGTQVPLLFILPHISSVVLFCGICCYIFACYGGGFAVMPSFAADTFGPKNIGSIYGKILLAWGIAGIVGPMNIEWSGSLSKALVHSGFTLLVGFVIAMLYRKPRLAPLPLDIQVGALAGAAKAMDAAKR
jgi:OFA family oxalate/formate antiporter-like MFS transporter